MSRQLRRLFSGRSKRSTATSSRTLELSDLSDWDLLCLMDVLPLEDLLRLRCVSHRFNQLAKRRQPDRRHLLLIIGHKLTCSAVGKTQSDYQNVIIVPVLTFTLVDRILTKLPSIVNLWVFNCSLASKNLEPIIYLLGCLSAQLQILQLTFTKAFHPPTSQQPLLATINRLAKLTSLNLDYRGVSALFTDDERTIIEMPIISQLVSLKFDMFTTSVTLGLEQFLFELIHRATTGPTQISFGANFDAASLDLLLNIPSGVADRFTLLQVYSYYFNLTDLANICHKFSQLTTLGINLNHLSIRQVTTNLAKLSHLSTLAWSIHFPYRTIWRQHPDETLVFFGEAAEPDVVDSSNLVPLPTVKMLVLRVWMTKHKDLVPLHLATVFPNVTTLNLIPFECVQCGYSPKKKIGIVHKRRCLMKLTKYWQVLPKLHELKLNGTVVPRRLWKPLPLVGISRGQLNSAIRYPVVNFVEQCYSWITSKFTFTV